MLFPTTSTALFLAGIVSLATAQDVVEIRVGQEAGENMFTFTPPSITAAQGSIVTFVFSGAPGNHSVTQSSFDQPCTPLDGGFDSGNILIPGDAPSSTTFPTWNLTITNDSEPIWFFCKQLRPQPHCVAGMVGAINAPSSGDESFETYQESARAFGGTVSQDVGGLVGQGASASAVPGPLSGEIKGFGLPTGADGAAPSSSTEGPSDSSAVGSVKIGALWTVTLSALVGVFVI